MKTRIACYFDVPRPDNKTDDINWVDVRAREPRVRLQIFRPFRLPPIALDPTDPKHPPGPVPVQRQPQIDLKHTDMKNDLKRKVAAKTGVPSWRLSMRLGPFQEVYMFDRGAKNGIMPKTFGITTMVHRPELVGNARFDALYFGAWPKDLPDEEPNPLADGWKQEWEGPNGVKEALKQYERKKR